MAIGPKSKSEDEFGQSNQTDSEIPYIRITPKVPTDPKIVEMAELVMNEVIAPKIDWEELIHQAIAREIQRFEEMYQSPRPLSLDDIKAAHQIVGELKDYGKEAIENELSSLSRP